MNNLKVIGNAIIRQAWLCLGLSYCGWHGKLCFSRPWIIFSKQRSGDGMINGLQWSVVLLDRKSHKKGPDILCNYPWGEITHGFQQRKWSTYDSSKTCNIINNQLMTVQTFSQPTTSTFQIRVYNYTCI